MPSAVLNSTSSASAGTMSSTARLIRWWLKAATTARSRPSCRRNCTSEKPTDDSGSTSRGKLTFFTKPALAVMLPAALLTPWLKAVKGSRPAIR